MDAFSFRRLLAEYLQERRILIYIDCDFTINKVRHTGFVPLDCFESITATRLKNGQFKEDKKGDQVLIVLGSGKPRHRPLSINFLFDALYRVRNGCIIARPYIRIGLKTVSVKYIEADFEACLSGIKKQQGKLALFDKDTRGRKMLLLKTKSQRS